MPLAAHQLAPGWGLAFAPLRATKQALKLAHAQRCRSVSLGSTLAHEYCTLPSTLQPARQSLPCPEQDYSAKGATGGQHGVLKPSLCIHSPAPPQNPQRKVAQQEG
jgi:hypothetical protein